MIMSNSHSERQSRDPDECLKVSPGITRLPLGKTNYFFASLLAARLLRVNHPPLSASIARIICGSWELE